MVGTTRAGERPFGRDDALFAPYVYLEAEKAFLSILRQNKSLAIESASGQIETESGVFKIHEELFGDIKNRLAYLAMIRTATDPNVFWSPQEIGRQATEIARLNGWPERLAGHYMNSLLADVSGHRVDVVLRSITDMYRRRRLVMLGYDFIEMVPPDVDVDAVEPKLVEKFLSVPQGDTERVVQYGDQENGYLSLLIERRRKFLAGQYNPIDWPWASWNALLNPISAGKYFLMLLKHGTGKSTVAANISEYWSQRKFHVAYILTEDPKEDWFDRQVVRWTGLPMWKIKSGNYEGDDEWKRVLRIQEMLREEIWPRIHFVEAYGKSQSEILHYLRGMKDSGRLDVAILDYMNGVRSEVTGRGQNDWRASREAERWVEWSAQEHTPLLICDQFSKAGESALLGGNANSTGQYGRVQNANCAKTICIGVRYKVKDQNGEWENGRMVAGPGEWSRAVQWIVDKQNDGRTGEFKQRFIGERFRLEDSSVVSNNGTFHGKNHGPGRPEHVQDEVFEPA